MRYEVTSHNVGMSSMMFYDHINTSVYILPVPFPTLVYFATVRCCSWTTSSTPPGHPTLLALLSWSLLHVREGQKSQCWTPMACVHKALLGVERLCFGVVRIHLEAGCPKQNVFKVWGEFTCAYLWRFFFLNPACCQTYHKKCPIMSSPSHVPSVPLFFYCLIVGSKWFLGDWGWGRLDPHQFSKLSSNSSLESFSQCSAGQWYIGYMMHGHTAYSPVALYRWGQQGCYSSMAAPHPSIQGHRRGKATARA